MKRYKEEVDALHASDTLKAQIAALPAETQPKRPKKRRIAAVAAIAAVLVVVLLGGAVSTPLLYSAEKSAARDTAEYDAAYSDDGYLSDEPNESNFAYGYATSKSSGLPSQSTSAPVLPSGRKLIRNAELNVETKTFDDFNTALMQKVSALGGYVESSESGAYSSVRYEHLVLRIPADSLDSFLQAVAALGTVTSQDTSVQDVTDKYVDVKSRLAALETEQETLLALLKKAENLTDILEIQDRLTEVRGTLESYKAQLQALESQIDYSTVTMTVNEVERVSPPEQTGFFAQVRQNLSENLYAIGQGARSFGIWFLSSLPYFAIWIVLIGLVVVVVLLIRRRRKKRRG